MKRRFLSGLLVVYAASTLLFTAVLPQTNGAQNPSDRSFSLSATDFGVLCLSSVYPGAVADLADSRDNEETGERAESGESGENSGKTEAAAVKEEKEEAPDPMVFGQDPAVLIVHTHATETYLPSSAGNYHSKKKENSVRDVGEVLAKSLEEEGISVVHDQTLHDDPSYNNSYNRSYETVQALLQKYPTIKCVIDLHRDAIASDSVGATVSSGGKTCAKYMYVVSTVVPGYNTNMKFISALNKTAAADFSGFTGAVLERGYVYNQDLADKYLLLEFGNNRNDIGDVRNTAQSFGKILAKTLKAGY